MNRRKALFIGHNALGDTLCTTPVVRAHRRDRPDDFIIYVCQDVEYCRVLECSPDIDLVVYSESMYFHGLSNYESRWARELPLEIRGTPRFLHFDMNRLATLPEVFEDHISKGFARLLGMETDTVRPVLELPSAARAQAAFYTPRPYVVLGMHSVTNLPTENGGLKEWGDDRWLALAKRLATDYDYDVIAVGSERDPRPASTFVRPLYGLPIRTVAALLEAAECVITLESGLGHLCAAVDAPTVLLYADIVPLAWANPSESTRCRVLYGSIRELELERVLEAFEQIAEPSRSLV
jgi:ADP-heptose:LPS heptosyltransferase